MGVPGPTLMLLTPFNIPAPAAFVIETPVDHILDFFGESLALRVIGGPRMFSESKQDLLEGNPPPIDGENLFGGRGALKDFVIGEGGGGDVKRSGFVRRGIRVRWGIDSLELEGEVLWSVA